MSGHGLSSAQPIALLTEPSLGDHVFVGTPTYQAFINEVTAQTEKKITTAAAAILIGYAPYRISHGS